MHKSTEKWLKDAEAFLFEKNCAEFYQLETHSSTMCTTVLTTLAQAIH